MSNIIIIPLFIDGETEAQRALATALRSQSWNLNAGSLTSEPTLFQHPTQAWPVSWVKVRDQWPSVLDNTPPSTPTHTHLFPWIKGSKSGLPGRAKRSTQGEDSGSPDSSDRTRTQASPWWARLRAPAGQDVNQALREGWEVPHHCTVADGCSPWWERRQSQQSLYVTQWPTKDMWTRK